MIFLLVKGPSASHVSKVECYTVGPDLFPDNNNSLCALSNYYFLKRSKDLFLSECTWRTDVRILKSSGTKVKTQLIVFLLLDISNTS